VTENIYRLIRQSKGNASQQPVAQALEYILVQLNDFGAMRWQEFPFHSTEEAVNFLAKQGYTIRLPRQ